MADVNHSIIHSNSEYSKYLILKSNEKIAGYVELIDNVFIFKIAILQKIVNVAYHVLSLWSLIIVMDNYDNRDI